MKVISVRIALCVFIGFFFLTTCHAVMRFVSLRQEVRATNIEVTGIGRYFKAEPGDYRGRYFMNGLAGVCSILCLVGSIGLFNRKKWARGLLMGGLSLTIIAVLMSSVFWSQSLDRVEKRIGADLMIKDLTTDQKMELAIGFQMLNRQKKMSIVEACGSVALYGGMIWFVRSRRVSEETVSPDAVA